MKNISSKFLFFNVDDNLLINFIDWSLIQKFMDNNFSIFSLRLGLNINYSYTGNQNIGTPIPISSNQKILKFKWFDRKCEWSDPMSVDGNIFKTNTIKNLIEIIEFNSPNTLESKLKKFSYLFQEKDFYSFEYSRITNIVMNRVQKEFDNRSGSWSTDTLLKKWNNGYYFEINLDNIISTHIEPKVINFKKRKI